MRFGPDVLDRHARRMAAGSANNRQPWVPPLLVDRRSRQRMARRLEQALDQPDTAAGRFAEVGRLKPGLGLRRLVLGETEVEAAMIVSSKSLVVALEERRNSDVSLATRVALGDPADPYWATRDFKQGWSELRRRRSDIRAAVRWMADADIRQYFPSLMLSKAHPTILDLTGLESASLRTAFKLLSAIAVPAGRLPIGPELSSGIGTGMLVGLDDYLVDRVGEAVVRWVDDLAIGVPTEAAGWALLEDAQRDGLAELGLSWHPVKTRVTPAESWTERGASYIDTDPEPSHEDLPLLTRNQARQRLDELGSELEDPERVVQAIADETGSLVAASGDVARALVQFGAPPPGIGDRAAVSLTRRARLGYSDSVAEAFLDLAEHEIAVGIPGGRTLVATATDGNVPGRTRAAAGWWLASTTETFDHRILDCLRDVRPYAARGLLGAAVIAGASPTEEQRRWCFN